MAITKSQRARLTLFLALTIAVTITFVAISVGSKMLKKHKSYYTLFKGESISGLNAGADVKLTGKKIGFVKTITFDSLDYSKIHIELSVFEEIHMKDDMLAKLELNGITGLKFIDIEGGTDTANVVSVGDYIGTKKSVVADMLAQTKEIMSGVNVIISNINALTDSSSSMSNILADVDEITDDLKAFTSLATGKLEGMSGSVETTLTHIEKISKNINYATAEFTEKSDIPKFLNDIDETVLSLKTLSESLTLTFGQSREDLGATMMDLRETMENINELSAMLVENPSLLLRGNTSQKRKIK